MSLLNLEENYFQLKEDLEHEKEINDLLMQRLHSVQEELEGYICEFGATEQKLQKVQNKLFKLEYRNKCCMNELAWYRGLLRAAYSMLWKSSFLFRRKIKKDAKLIETTSVFDEKFYIENYPDVLCSKLTPSEHYILYGSIEGRQPSLNFSTLGYIHQYPDLADSAVQPAVHFVKFGKQEGRLSVKDTSNIGLDVERKNK